MTGFKNFILRGNLVELAVAFVMAAGFVMRSKQRLDASAKIDVGTGLQ